ncbi:rluD [Symbiodinium sp. CCMP2456]|nr:rluD [Symbiodinium sp. CCMP2456]
MQSCDELASAFRALQRRVKAHAPKVVCSFCKRKFKIYQDLQSHITTKHAEDPHALQSLSQPFLGWRLQVAFEDDWLAVVVKPQRVPTFGKGSLDKASWLLGQLSRSQASDSLGQATPVHRLDAATGGLLVLAKTRSALRILSATFAEGLVKKRYRALVRGSFPLGFEGRSEEPLYGKRSVTRFTSVAAPVETPQGPVSTLDLWPESGRRHQLRRHLSMLGSPILGDRRYGGRDDQASKEEDHRSDSKEHHDDDADEACMARGRRLHGSSPGAKHDSDNCNMMPLFLWALQLSFPHPRHRSAEQRAGQDQKAITLFPDFLASLSKPLHVSAQNVSGGYDPLQHASREAVSGGNGTNNAPAQLIRALQVLAGDRNWDLGYHTFKQAAVSHLRQEPDAVFIIVVVASAVVMAMRLVVVVDVAVPTEWLGVLLCAIRLLEFYTQHAPWAKIAVMHHLDGRTACESEGSAIVKFHTSEDLRLPRLIRFVLLVVNGGDAPLTLELQEQIESLDHLRACFANNLQSPRLPDLFFPLPLGLTSETLLEQVRQKAKPWELRDRRLLVAPMRLHNRLRKRYLDALADREYGDVVHIVSESLPYEAFLVLVSQHQSILSPPGRGYDCGRTWQALALGTVPLVARDEQFDQRLFEGGPSYMPAPEDLSPELLLEVLTRLADPAEHLEKLTRLGDSVLEGQVEKLLPLSCTAIDHDWMSHAPATSKYIHGGLTQLSSQMRMTSEARMEVPRCASLWELEPGPHSAGQAWRGTRNFWDPTCRVHPSGAMQRCLTMQVFSHAATVLGVSRVALQPSPVSMCGESEVKAPRYHVISVAEVLSNQPEGDVAWSVLAPGLCCDADVECGREVFTDGAMEDLLGDVSQDLLALDEDPEPLRAWLGSHGRSGTRFVGHYYESLVHFAFAELGKVPVALYSEPIPKEKRSNKSAAGPPGAVVRRFKPALKSSWDVDFFCSIHEAAFLEGGQLRISFKVKRGRSREALPLPEHATLASDGGLRKTAHYYSPRAPPDSGIMDGEVFFEDVPVSDELEFTYAPGFSAVPLRPTKTREPIQGEVDYILQPDLSSPRFLHLEVAVKFYLAAKEEVATWDDFIAPNPRDVLGLKLRHMLSHQLKMGQTDHIRNLLAARAAGQSAQSLETQSRLWMNGRLFLPVTEPLDESRERPESWHSQIPMLSPNLEVGWWCRFRDLDRVLPAAFRYLVLKKPYWLAPLRGSGGRHLDHGRLRTRRELLKEAKAWNRFQYIAVLAADASSFEELCRGFVVPDEWPETRRERRPRSSSSSPSIAAGSN